MTGPFVYNLSPLTLRCILNLTLQREYLCSVCFACSVWPVWRTSLSTVLYSFVYQMPRSKRTASSMVSDSPVESTDVKQREYPDSSYATYQRLWYANAISSSGLIFLAQVATSAFRLTNIRTTQKFPRGRSNYPRSHSKFFQLNYLWLDDLPSQSWLCSAARSDRSL